ncbi:MAG: hypothetical protein ACP5SP_07340, partial [Caldisericum sp.]
KSLILISVFVLIIFLLASVTGSYVLIRVFKKVSANLKLDMFRNVEKNIVAFFEEFENKLGIKITECESVNEIKKYNFRLTGCKEYFVPSDLTLELTYRCNHR